MQSSTKLRLAIATLGCKTNFYESAAIVEGFADAILVDFAEDADIYIINTCTVTNRTDYKSRNLIRKALKQKAQNPAVRIVVTGCFAQRSAAEIAALGEIDFIIDNQAKLDIAEIMNGRAHTFCDIMEAKEFSFKPIHSMLDHTRAFQKIQDGCDYYCSYCAVPYARGHSRSARFEDVISQARIFADRGFKEIVLGGVNVGLYRDKNKTLTDVIQAMAGIPNLELIRISSIEPQLFSRALLNDLSGVSKLCPHFHIPLQSGSDSILKAMGRRYTAALAAKLVEDILGLYPDAAIGFDVICGFPGETQSQFAQTLAFLESLPIAYLHVFSYSARKGTPAASMPHQVHGKEKTRRAGILTALSASKKAEYAQRLKTQNPMIRGVVEYSEQGCSESLSDHFLKIKLDQRLDVGEFIGVAATDCEFLIDP
jgi:threonylcarbamoyladenosine tRNA methylthiotransferase MtaB